MCVDRTKNDNSVSIQMNTGAYLATVVPLIHFYMKNKGLEINSKQTNGLVVLIKEVAQQKDARGTIVSTLVDLEVDGEHVKVTTYDTTGLVRVQGKGQQKFAEQLLIPHLEKNVILNAREIKMTNELILMHSNKLTKTKPTRAIRKNAIRKPKSDNDETNNDDSDSELCKNKLATLPSGRMPASEFFDTPKQAAILPPKPDQTFQCNKCHFNLLSQETLESHIALTHLPTSNKTIDLTSSQKLIMPNYDADTCNSEEDDDYNEMELTPCRSNTEVDQLQLLLVTAVGLQSAENFGGVTIEKPVSEV